MIAHDDGADEQSSEKASTTVALRPSTKERLDELKPFDRATYDDVVTMILDERDEGGD